jgi:integrase/recombinase XerD
VTDDLVDARGERLRRSGAQYLVRQSYRWTGVGARVPKGALVHALRHTMATRLEISDVAATASLDMVRDQGPIRDLGFSAVSSAG